jgi:hypothetical protein
VEGGPGEEEEGTEAPEAEPQPEPQEPSQAQPQRPSRPGTEELEPEVLPEDISELFPDDFPVNPEGLLGYLENLTHYLPPFKRRRYLESDMKLKMSVLRNKLSGKRGLRERLQHGFHEDYDQSERPVRLSEQNVEKTFEFISDLSSYIPDKDTGYAVKHKVSNILSSMRRKSDDEK